MHQHFLNADRVYAPWSRNTIKCDVCVCARLWYFLCDFSSLFLCHSPRAHHISRLFFLTYIQHLFKCLVLANDWTSLRQFFSSSLNVARNPWKPDLISASFSSSFFFAGVCVCVHISVYAYSCVFLVHMPFFAFVLNCTEYLFLFVPKNKMPGDVK